MLLRHQNRSRNKDLPIVKRIFQQEKIQIKPTKNEQTINKCEMFLFFIFCISMLIIIYNQEDIERLFKLHTTLKSQISTQDLQAVSDASSFYKYAQSLIGGDLTFSKQGIKTNQLQIPIQFTQRRINLSTNTRFGKSFPDWTSNNFSADSDSLQGNQSTTTYGVNVNPRVQSAFTYSGSGFGYLLKGGFTFQFDKANLNTQTIQDLSQGQWIDKQTKTIAIGFITKSTSFDLFSVIQIQFNQGANGLLKPALRIISFRQRYYQSNLDYFRLVCEIIYCILWLYYLIIEIKQLFTEYKQVSQYYDDRIQKLQEKQQIQKISNSPLSSPKKNFKQIEKELSHPKNKNLRALIKIQKSCCRKCCKGMGKHFSSAWNWVDVGSLILSTMNIALWIAFTVRHQSIMNNKNYFYPGKTPQVDTPQQYKNNHQLFDQLIQMNKIYTFYTIFVSINALLVFLRVLKYLAQATKRVTVLLNTLYYSGEMTVYFMVMLLTIFFAFALMGYICFGDKISKLSRFGRMCFALFKSLMGDSDDLSDAFKAEPTLTFFYFISYMVGMQFILTNLFIAFLGQSYGEAQERAQLDDKFQSLGWWFKLKRGIKHLFCVSLKNFFKKLCGCCCGGKKNGEEGGRNLSTQGLGDPSMFVRRKSKSGCCGKKKKKKKNIQKGQLQVQNGIQLKDMEEISKKVNYSAKQYDVQDKILQNDVDQKNQSDQQAQLDDIDIRNASLWDARPAQGQFTSDSIMISTLMTERQLQEKKLKKQQYYGRVCYGALIFFAFIIIYITILTQQLGIQQSFQLRRSSTQQLSATLEGISNFSDFLSTSQSTLQSLAKDQENNGVLKVGTFLPLINNIYRITFRLAQQSSHPRRINQLELSAYQSGEQRQNFFGAVSGRQYTYSRQGGFLNQGGFSFLINAADPVTLKSQIQSFNQDMGAVNQRLWYIVDDMILYQGTTDTFQSLSLNYLFPPDGSIKATVSSQIVALDPYLLDIDRFRAFLEIIYVTFLVIFIVIFIRVMIRESRSYRLWYTLTIKPLGPRYIKIRNRKNPQFLRKFEYLFSFYRIFDIASFLTSIITIIFWIVFLYNAIQAHITFPNNKTDFFFERLLACIQFRQRYINACSVNTLFMAIRMLAFLNQNQQMSVLCKTLVNGRIDIFYFMIILFCIMFGFVTLSNIQFGQFSQKFSTYWFSVVVCFQYIIGQFDYDEELNITGVNSVMAPIFFIIYMILFVLIITNIFLTIIDTSYQDVKRQVKLISGQQKLSTCNILCFCCLSRKNRKREAYEEKDEKGYEQYNEKMVTQLRQIELLQIDLGTQLRDQNAWTLRMAQDIKKQVEFRIKMRNQNKQMRQERRLWLRGDKKKGKQKDGDNGGKMKDQRKKEEYSEFKQFHTRVSYWSYLRNAIRFVEFQCERLNQEIDRLRNLQLGEEGKLLGMKNDSNTLYEIIKAMETPLQQNLNNIDLLRKQVKKLKGQYQNLQKVHFDEQQKQFEKKKP